MKGQRSRAGFSGMTGFEGGQMPLIRRVPKRGFRHTAFRLECAVVNVSDFENRFEAQAAVTPQVLKDQGLIKGCERVKVLGDGNLSRR